MTAPDLPDPAETERPVAEWLALWWDESTPTYQAVSRVLSENAKLRADIAYRQDEKEITLHIQDEYSSALRAMARKSVYWRGLAHGWYENYNGALLERDAAREHRDRLTARLAELEAANVELRENLERSREWRDTWHAKWREVSAENADLARQLADQRVRADHWCERAEQLRLAAAPDQAVREDRPAVGDCGNASPGNWLAMSTCVNPSHCTLPFGHQGWHRDARTGARWGKEWSDPADEVREEWARVEGNYDSSDIEHDDIHLDGELVRMHARKWGGTVYRRTVTTTPWVAAPPTPEPEDGEG